MRVERLEYVLLDEDTLHSEVQILARLHIIHKPIVFYSLRIEDSELLKGLMRGLLLISLDLDLELQYLLVEILGQGVFHVIHFI